jgi:hypothetical protein
LPEENRRIPSILLPETDPIRFIVEHLRTFGDVKELREKTKLREGLPLFGSEFISEIAEFPKSILWKFRSTQRIPHWRHSI